jgi:adenylate cyclase
VGVYRVLSFPGAAAHRVVKAKTATERKWRKTAFAATTVVVLGVGALLIWNFLLRPTPPRVEPASVEKMAFPLPEKPSIAVLPFDNLSGDAEQDYIADGISDNIITALSYIPEMFVIARNSSFTYKGKPVKVQQVSEELGVRYILEGSVLKSGDKVRITAQLIDALTGGHMWSKRYERDLKDLLKLLDEITLAITVSLQVKLTHGEQARMWFGSTINFEAWGHLVKGMGIFYYFSKEAMAKSRELFKQALEIDPNYAHAVTMLGWTHKIDAQIGYTDSRDESFKRAFELAKKSVAMNDRDPNVHSLLSLLYQMQGEHDKAIEEGRKAIDLGPNDAAAHILFGEVLYLSGIFEESVEMCEKAIRLHPHTPLYYLGHMMVAYYWTGRYEDTLTTAEQLIDRGRKVGYWGGVRWGHARSALALMQLGRESEAREHIAQIFKISPNFNLNDVRWQIYKDPAHLQQILDALRKLGVPEHSPKAESKKP